MKKTKNIIGLVFAFMAFTGCEIAEPIESEITYYPELELIGEEIFLVEEGNTFEDPGITAQVEGEDVPFEVNNEVDTSTPGMYTVTYEATNEDGFSVTIDRTVVVYEDNGTVAGYWHGSSGNGTGFPILVSSTDDPNVFEITDVLAGHYEYGVNYGPAYAVPSTITVAGGTVTSPGGPNAFGSWTVDAPSITADQTRMTWGATLVDQGFSLSGLAFDKVTP